MDRAQVNQAGVGNGRYRPGLISADNAEPALQEGRLQGKYPSSASSSDRSRRSISSASACATDCSKRSAIAFHGCFPPARAWRRNVRADYRPRSSGVPMDRMPALFVGHGSPMNTLETNGYTEAWRALGSSFPAHARSSSSRLIGTSARPLSPRCRSRGRSTTSRLPEGAVRV